MHRWLMTVVVVFRHMSFVDRALSLEQHRAVGSAQLRDRAVSLFGFERPCSRPTPRQGETHCKFFLVSLTESK